MCHLILFLPVLSLPIFWLAPPWVSVPAYVVISGFSATIYYLAIKTMRQPVLTGREALLHSVAEVIDKENKMFYVRAGSEIWNAESDGDVSVGDIVEIIGLNGLKLKVRRQIDKTDS